MNIETNIHFNEYYFKCPLEFLDFYSQLFYTESHTNFYKLKNKFINYEDVLKELVKNSDMQIVTKSCKYDFEQIFGEICDENIKYVDYL